MCIRSLITLQVFRKSSVFNTKEHFVPEQRQQPSDIWHEQLSMPGKRPTEYRLDPGILPGQTRDSKLSSQVPGHLFRLLKNVEPLRVEVNHPVLQELHTRSSDSFTVLQRPKITDM